MFRDQYVSTFRGGHDTRERINEWWSDYICHKADEPMSFSELEHIREQQAK